MIVTAKPNGSIDFGPFVLDRTNKRVLRKGKRISLGPLEVKLLETLLSDPRRVFSADELRILVWSDDPNSESPPAADPNALYVAMSKLRTGLGRHGKWIVNIPKVGYTISEEADLAAASGSTTAAGENIESLFVGRESELEHVLRAVFTSPRILTIVGPTGIGKTRLAREVSIRAEGRFEDGVHFVDLRAIEDGEFIPKALIATLDLPEIMSQDVLGGLVSAVRDRSMLVIFDNCEHLVDDVAKVATAIAKAAPGVRVLATSTQSLRLTTEIIVHLAKLDVPPHDAVQDSDDLLKYPSTTLFLGQVNRRRPDLEIQAQDARNIAELCRQLEGIPGAIELAAAQVGAYTIEQVLSAMSDRLTLLRTRGGDTTRHETLESALDWSYGLLSNEERSLLRRLSVMRGGWSAVSAQAICSDDEVREKRIVHLLAGLVRRSLVQLSLSTGRYEMLEMVRQFARDRLQQAGEEESFLHRRAAYFLRVAEDSLTEGGSAEWTKSMQAEYDNIRAVLRRSLVDKVEPLVGIRLCGALRRFWLLSCNVGEALTWVDLALENDDGSDLEARGGVLTSAALFFGRLTGGEEDVKKRLSYCEESLDIWRKLGDVRNLGVTLIGYSELLNRLGRHDEAIAAARDALERFRNTDLRFNTPRAVNNLGIAYMFVGKFDSAMPLLEESLAEARQSDDKLLLAVSLHNLCELAIHMNDLDSAKFYLNECLATVEQVGQIATARTRLLHSELLGRLGKLWEAIQIQKSLLLEFEQMQDIQNVAITLETLGSTLANQHKELVLAAELIGAANSLRHKLCILRGPARDAEIDHTLTAISKSIGKAECTEALARGSRISIEQAIDSAMELQI